VRNGSGYSCRSDWKTRLNDLMTHKTRLVASVRSCIRRVDTLARADPDITSVQISLALGDAAPLAEGGASATTLCLPEVEMSSRPAQLDAEPQAASIRRQGFNMTFNLQMSENMAADIVF
jgi:hypothetical protein